MNMLLTFRSSLLTGVALAWLATGGEAFAQALPPIIHVQDDPPVLMPSPTNIYPPTVAPTEAPPYFVPPAWSQKLPPNLRFVILSGFNNDAVLDRETGLVWTRRTVEIEATLFESEQACRRLVLADRMGWRLPTVAELQSLVDRSAPVSLTEPRLPVGHPFVLSVLVVDHDYWAAEAHVDFRSSSNPPPVARWRVSLNSGSTGFTSSSFTGLTRGVLCIRGHRMSTEMY